MDNSRAVVVAAIAVPVAILALNPEWFVTNVFVPPWFDPFVYKALFRHPVESISAHPTYYPVTRIPAVAFGALFYAALPELIANFTFKIVLAVSALLALGATLRRLVGPATAALVVGVAGTYPFFVMAMGWDYIDPNGYVNGPAVGEDLDWYAAHDYVQQKPDLTRVIDNSYVDHALGVLGKYAP